MSKEDIKQFTQDAEAKGIIELCDSVDLQEHVIIAVLQYKLGITLEEAQEYRKKFKKQ